MSWIKLANRGSARRGGRLVRRSGTATLELALTLSILFSICYGLIEYGYFFFVKNTMEGAAREGCRAAIVTGATMTSANTAVENQLQAAGLITSSNTPSGSGPFTIGNYTVYYYDTAQGSSVPTVNPPGTMPQNNISTMANVPVGDTVTVWITATWGTVGAGFRPMALIGASKTVWTGATMRKEGD
jgi:Flp pilus assembly protein TadG